MLRSLKGLHGFAIGAIDGDIGTVTDCYFDDASFTVRFVVVETGGWLAGRRAPLADRVRRGRLGAPADRDRAEQGPGGIESAHRHAEAGVEAARDHLLRPLRLSARPWSGPYLWGASPYPSSAPGAPAGALALEHERRWNWEQGPHDPHLRSSAAVTGHHIQATDGDIGHVEDFLLDDRSWTIRFMVVDTTNWWAGEKVLIAPAWIERVDWDHSKVHVTVTRAQNREESHVRPGPSRRTRRREAAVPPQRRTRFLARLTGGLHVRHHTTRSASSPGPVTPAGGRRDR